jgi:hypothetical protein
MKSIVPNLIVIVRDPAGNLIAFASREAADAG